MNLYDIIADIIGYYYQQGVNFNTNIINVCCVIIVLLFIWFLDCLTRLFLRH